MVPPRNLRERLTTLLEALAIPSEGTLLTDAALVADALGIKSYANVISLIEQAEAEQARRDSAPSEASQDPEEFRENKPQSQIRNRLNALLQQVGCGVQGGSLVEDAHRIARKLGIPFTNLIGVLEEAEAHISGPPQCRERLDELLRELGSCVRYSGFLISDARSIAHQLAIPFESLKDLKDLLNEAERQLFGYAGGRPWNRKSPDAANKPSEEELKQQSIYQDLEQELSGFEGSERRKKLRELQLRWHPDKNVDCIDPDMANTTFRCVQSMWEREFR